MVIERWIYDENRNIFKLLKLPTLIGYLILRKVKNMVYAVGMGRHSKEEVYHILEEDFKAVSNYLGTLLSTFVYYFVDRCLSFVLFLLIILLSVVL